MQTSRSILVTAVLATAACPGSDDAPADSSTSVSSNPGESSGTQTDTDAGTTGTGSTSTGPVSTTSAVTSAGESDEESGPPIEPPLIFDTNKITDAGVLEQGCKAVDFLFVIDNSGSMDRVQTQLVANFPTFIDGITSTLVNVDSFHVGVTTSDAYSFNLAGCNVDGGLVVRTGGSRSSDMQCGPYADGANYMTESDDLEAAFSCAADVGISGNASERPMETMIAAIDGGIDGPGLCNEGFVREDALLVVTVITDEADGPGDADGLPPASSPGTPQTWHDAVVAAKNDLEENAAVLVLANYEGGNCPPVFPSDDGANIVEFAGLFGQNGFVGGICELDYEPIFTEAIALIADACENFLPPG